MNDVRIETPNVGADCSGKTKRHAEFIAPGDGDGRDGDQIAFAVEGRHLAGRRIYANFHAALDHMSSKLVKRAISSISRIVIVAGEESNAGRARPCGDINVVGHIAALVGPVFSSNEEASDAEIL